MNTDHSDLPKMEESLPAPASAGLPKPRLMPFFVGAASATVFLVLSFGAWFTIHPTSRPTSESQVSGPEPTKPNEKQAASTMAYWNALIECDKKQLKVVHSTQVSADGSENPFSSFQGQLKVAAIWSAAMRTFISEVSQLPVRDVDDELLKSTQGEIRLAQKVATHLDDIADSAAAVIDWSVRKQALPENLWGDLLDSFLDGLSGRPLAGYQKAQAKSAQLDSEGQLLVQNFLFQVKAHNDLEPDMNAHRVNELGLRSILAKKYGVEFPARPE